MVINNITMTSSTDGEGLRTVIWFQGCSHGCKGCHNKHTWDISKGTTIKPQAVVNQIQNWKSKNKLSGLHLTLSGGEPFDQAADAFNIAKQLNPTSLWIFTGYTLEQLLQKRDSNITALLEKATILVDGRYEEDIPPSQVFAGSGNQRIIDLQRFAELPSPAATNFAVELQRLVVTNKYNLPEGYVHSSKTRTSDTCPKCSRICSDDLPFERIRRITGYLVGTLDRFNVGKRAEEADRIKHA